MGFFSSVKKAFKKAVPTIASGGLNQMAKSGASALPYMGFAGGAGGGPSSAFSLDTNWADLAGTALSGGASAYGQYSANKQNAQLAQNQMDFQERMSSTAHQREVRDLRLAGLNPILSGTGGMGASSGPGATASMDNVAGAGVASALEALTKITQSYLIREQTDRAKAETENIKTTNPQIRAQTKKTEQETNSSKALEKNLEMDTVLKLSQRLKNLSEVNKNDELTKLLTKQGVSQEMQARLMSLQGDQALEMLKGMKLEGQIDETTYGDIMRHVKRFFDALPFSGSTSKRF
jgi:CCR4-NOT transcriptional regulation complex NOT5 subunit